MSTPVLVIGEALIDIVQRQGHPDTEHVGGSPLNVAVGLARLGHPTELATHLARDPRGATIIEHLAVDGVALTPGSDAAQRTPTATAVIGDDGSATYQFDITWSPPLPASPAAHLHAGSYGAHLGGGGEAVLQAMVVASERGTVSYDPNIRAALLGPRREVLAQVTDRVAASDIVKASDEDLAWLAGVEGQISPEQATAQLAEWIDSGAALAVATLGPLGAIALTAAGEVIRLPGREVAVADTVGAGDSFSAGLISGLLDAGLAGRDAGEALRAATADEIRPAVQRAILASSITVSRAGADPPTRRELAAA